MPKLEAHRIAEATKAGRVIIGTIAGIVGGSVAAILVLLANKLVKNDWEAASAIATTAATFVALWSSWNAIRMPERQREADRRSSTDEILRASRYAIVLYRTALRIYPNEQWKSARVRRISARASHISGLLQRLVQKPELSDGAIATAMASIQLLHETTNASAVFFTENGLYFGEKASAHLKAVEPVANDVRRRARKVAAWLAVNK